MVPQETAIHGSKVPRNPSKGSKDKGDEPSCIAGRWTQEEHMLFLQGLDLHGKEWKKISKMVKSRSLVQIRSHAQKYFQKLSATADEDDDASAASGGRVLLMNGKRGGARFEKTATTTALPPKKKSGSSKVRGGCVQASSSAPAPSSSKASVSSSSSTSSKSSKSKKKRSSTTRGSVHVKAAVAASSATSKKSARTTVTSSDDHSVHTTKSTVSASTAHHSVASMKREQAVPDSDVESDGSAGADYGSSTSGTSVDSMSEAFAVEGDIEALDMMHPDDIDLFLNDLFPEDGDHPPEPQLAAPQLMAMQQPTPMHLLPTAPAPMSCGAPTFQHYVQHVPSLTMGHPPTLSMVHQVYPPAHPVVHSAPYFIDNSVHTHYVPEHIDTWMSTVDIQQLPGHMSLTPFVVTNPAT